MDKSTPEATEQVAAPQETVDSQVTDSGSSADQAQEVVTNDDSQASSSTSDAAVTATDDTASQFDDDLDSWAEKRGYGSLETEKERRIAQDARNNQRDFHKERAGEQLNTQVSEAFVADDDEDDRYAAIEQRLAVAEARDKTRDFFDTHPEAKEFESAMVEILKDEQEKYGADAARWLGRDLGRLYTLAKSSKTVDKTAAAVEQARREERESLAQKQAAAAPQGAASTQTAPKKDDAAAALRGMSTQEWYQKKASGWNPIRDM